MSDQERNINKSILSKIESAIVDLNNKNDKKNSAWSKKRHPRFSLKQTDTKVPFKENISLFKDGNKISEFGFFNNEEKAFISIKHKSYPFKTSIGIDRDGNMSVHGENFVNVDNIDEAMKIVLFDDGIENYLDDNS